MNHTAWPDERLLIMRPLAAQFNLELAIPPLGFLRLAIVGGINRTNRSRVFLPMHSHLPGPIVDLERLDVVLHVLLCVRLCICARLWNGGVVLWVC
jgi:hypothetical protein